MAKVNLWDLVSSYEWLSYCLIRYFTYVVDANYSDVVCSKCFELTGSSSDFSGLTSMYFHRISGEKEMGFCFCSVILSG